MVWPVYTSGGQVSPVAVEGGNLPCLQAELDWKQTEFCCKVALDEVWLGKRNSSSDICGVHLDKDDFLSPVLCVQGGYFQPPRHTWE